MFVIYVAHCLATDKSYVGQTCCRLAKRKWSHVNRTDYRGHFQRALRKHGPTSFEWQVVAEVETKEQADNLERLWIGLLDTTDRRHGYNMVAGGGGSVGLTRSPEARIKNSEYMKRAWATGQRIPGRLGIKCPHSQTTKDKISTALKARPKAPRKVCCVSTCTHFVHSYGMCSAHSHRYLRYGDPQSGAAFRRTRGSS